MAVNLQPVPEFIPDAELGASLATRWRLWLRDFDTFLLASGITDAKRQKALLLYQAGPRVREIFAQLPETGGEDAFVLAKEKLTEYFEPQQNKRYEVYRFRETKQGNTETLDSFHTRLRNMAKTCEFADETFEIEEQIIIGGRSSRIRKRALRDPNYALKDMLLGGIRDESSTYQAKHIESKEEMPAVPAVTHRFRANQQSTSQKVCSHCGGAFPHKGLCPAKGKTCRNCNKPNHFAVACRSSKTPQQHKAHFVTRKKSSAVRPLQHENDHSEDEYMYAVGNTKHTAQGTPRINVTVGGYRFPILVDTGSTINVIDKNTFDRMKDIKLQQTKVKAYPYNTTNPVHFLGKFESLIQTKSRYAVSTFFVLKEENSGCLLSASTAQEMGIINVNLNKIAPAMPGKQGEIQIKTDDPQIISDDPQINEIVQDYKAVFTGLGKLKGYSVKLNIDENAIPQAQPQRRVPFHIRKKVQAAVKELEREGIIETVPEDSPAQWVSPIVAVPKKDDSVRLCVDMRMPNKAIKRVRYPIPTVNDISIELNGAKFFSKLDLAQAYHQLPLHEDSRYITTFNTHLGLYRYTRLNYGTNAAMEIFQHVLQQNLQGIKGVLNLADDIFVFGKTRQEHDIALRNCLERLQDRGLTLNPKKCKFLQSSINFFGQIFSQQGTRPDPKRIEDLANASVPVNAKDVRSLLGMANYSAKYIPNYATITAHLRELTKKHVPFSWKECHQEAFEKLTIALSQAPVMGYFDVNRDTFVTVDASPVGISAILSQATPGSNDYTVIAYASRALSDVEKRYSQTEKEALSIVWGVEHFHLFLYGKEFTLVTDHNPLEVIYGTAASKPSARIERWVLRLQPYTFRILYRSGSENAADYLSRHPVKKGEKQQEKLAEEYVNFVTRHSVPKAMTLEEIARETKLDRTLQRLHAAIRVNMWDTDCLKPYRSLQDELTIGEQGIILRGTRIVIPTSLHQRAVDIAHENHQGISKTKALLREKVWFPGIDDLVQQTMQSCIACQAVGKPAPPEPLHLQDMPKGPWKKLHIDFYGPLPSGEYLLVVIDRYSRFPEVEIVRSTKASVVIPKLDKIFSVHGIPEAVKTDNGPPFSGEEFARYLTTLGIAFEPSIPCWPQANGEVERFNRSLGKALKTAVTEGKVWRQELHRFLLQYRTTPHSTTKVAPCELLFNRSVRGKLPSLDKKLVVNKHREACENERTSQSYQKEYADKRRHAKESTIQVGDTVLVRQYKQNKLTTTFNKVPYIVVSRKGTKVTAENSKHKITRNVSHFKRVNAHVNLHPDCSESEDEDECDYDDYVDHNAEHIDNRGNANYTGRPTRNLQAPNRYGNPIPSDIL